ncbi:hypothetical protein ACTI_47480 [Actinoplanes sp. OR16]|nr:hypothetical protein ACTI_47480 [Actinoplanes sp. OR16]
MWRARLTAAVVALVILVAGLAVRLLLPAGAFSQNAGTALYAALIYAGVVVVAPAVRPITAGLVAVGFCWAVELLQLTPVPSHLSDRSLIARLVLGAHFDPADMIWYPVGVLTLVAAHLIVRRPGQTV